MRLRTAVLGAAMLGAALTGASPASAAEAIYGVTTNNVLVTFHSDSPGAIRHAVPIAGLQPSEQILAIDKRPKTNQLYGLGSTSRIYVINPTSGSTVALGSPFSPALAGGQFGFDFNPVVDRVRIVSDGRQNLRLNPDDGAVTAQDGQIAYNEADSGAGTTPSAAAAAYTNNVPGATETQLFVIDSARDALVLQNPPNDGKLSTVGALNVDVVEPVTFDVGTDGRGWVAAKRAGGSDVELMLVDLKSGALSNGSLFPIIDGTQGAVRGIAAVGQVPDDKTASVLLVAVDRRHPLKRLRRALRADVSCSEACTLAATLQLRGRTVAEAFGKLPAAGKVRLTLKPSKGTQALVKRKKLVRLVLNVTAQDAAGNNNKTSRSIRYEP